MTEQLSIYEKAYDEGYNAFMTGGRRMNSLDKALQNIQTWQEAALAASIKQSYKLWREDGMWQSKINGVN